MAVKNKHNGDSAASADSESTTAASMAEDEEFSELMKSKSEEYATRIAKLQEEYLLPLKEDLADWINRVLGEYRYFIF